MKLDSNVKVWETLAEYIEWWALTPGEEHVGGAPSRAVLRQEGDMAASSCQVAQAFSALMLRSSLQISAQRVAQLLDFGLLLIAQTTQMLLRMNTVNKALPIRILHRLA